MFKSMRVKQAEVCYNRLMAFEFVNTYMCLKQLEKLACACVRKGMQVDTDVVSSVRLNAASFINLLTFRAIEQYRNSRKLSRSNFDALAISMDCLERAKKHLISGVITETEREYLSVTSNYEFDKEDLRDIMERQAVYMRFLYPTEDYESEQYM